MNKLYIVRGLPGSGKSTYVQDNYDSLYEDWFEADMFFESDLTGKYIFDKKLISDAHNWCYFNVLKSLNNGLNVWVSNTFVKLWEMEKYLTIGEKLNREIEIYIIEMDTVYESIHDVPIETIDRMSQNWEELTEDMKIKYKFKEIDE